MRAGLDADIERKDWRNAAFAASNLSQLYLTLGDVAGAVDAAKQSVKYTDESGDVFQRMVNLTTHADALHQAGDIERAEALFREAEAMQGEEPSQPPILYSVWGFRYCDLLLGTGRHEDARQRAEKSRELMKQAGKDILSPALDTLTIGRAAMAGAVETGSKDFLEAEKFLDDAVEALRRAGSQDHIPRGLLARAELYRRKGAFDQTRKDLDAAMDIAERSGMKLHLADGHLESSRLAIDEKDKPAALEHLGKAKSLIDECGYRRRKEEVEELQDRLG